MTALDTEDQFLTPDEIASLLKLRTPRPVYNAIRAGDLDAIEIGRRYRVTPAALRSYLERKRARPQLAPLQPAVSMRELIDAA